MMRGKNTNTQWDIEDKYSRNYYISFVPGDGDNYGQTFTVGGSAVLFSLMVITNKDKTTSEFVSLCVREGNDMKRLECQ